MVSNSMRYPSAFISSTFTDLKRERQIVTQLFKELNIVPQALDTRPASNNSSKSEIIKGIRESDFIVLIIANKYGTIDKTFTGQEKKSITWWEYDMAINTKKPIIPIFKNGSLESDKDPEKEELLKRFKNILTRNHSPQYFDTDQELYQKVLHSIIPAYRDALTKETQAKSVLATENEKLKSEIQILQSKLNPVNYTSNNILGLESLLRGQAKDTNSNLLSGLFNSLYIDKK